MKLQNLLAAILCAVTTLAHSSETEQTEPLEILLVTGTRILQPLNQSMFHSTVITEQEIQASQSVDVPGLLKGLAGVEIYQSGGIGKQSSVFMRGSNSGHMLVLVDGTRINSATSGATAIDQLMLDQIERIEVVRGNASSLYGSEAIGGVIQIFTKQARGRTGFNLSGGAGSHNTQRVSAGFAGEAGDTSFNAHVSKFKTDGVSAIKSSIVPTVNADQDGYANISLLTNAHYAINTNHKLSASVFDSQGEAETDNSFGLATDANVSDTHIQKLALELESRFDEHWQSKIQLAQGADNTTNFLNGAPDSALGAQFKTTSNQISWQNTLRPNARNSLNIGVENLSQLVACSTAFTRDRRTATSLFAGYTGSLDAHQLQLNLRQDSYSDFGKVNTGLLGYGYFINDAWRTSASVATAFKAPTMNDLFYPYTDFGFGFSYQGNPGLRPERSRNVELDVHYAMGAHRIIATYFDNRIRDLIVNNGLPASTMINLAEARSNGFEFAYTGQFGETDVKVALTRQNPRDVNSGLVLVRRAKSFGNAAITQNMGAWKVGGEIQHSGMREDYDINTFALTTLDSYTLYNFTASYTYSKSLRFSLRADNLFDKDYMLAHGYNTLGRSVLAVVDFQQ